MWFTSILCWSKLSGVLTIRDSDPSNVAFQPASMSFILPPAVSISQSTWKGHLGLNAISVTRQLYWSPLLKYGISRQNAELLQKNYSVFGQTLLEEKERKTYICEKICSSMEFPGKMQKLQTNSAVSQTLMEEKEREQYICVRSNWQFRNC